MLHGSFVCIQFYSTSTFPWQTLWFTLFVSVLHQDEGGIGKSIPDFRDFPRPWVLHHKTRGSYFWICPQLISCLISVFCAWFVFVFYLCVSYNQYTAVLLLLPACKSFSLREDGWLILYRDFLICSLQRGKRSKGSVQKYLLKKWRVLLMVKSMSLYSWWENALCTT